MLQGGAQCKFNPVSVAATVSISKPVTYIKNNDVKAMMAAVANKQVLAVTASSLPEEFQNYK